MLGIPPFPVCGILEVGGRACSPGVEISPFFRVAAGQ